MHELSIAYAVVRTVSERIGSARAVKVRLRIGVLAGVVPQALDFGWEVATAGTPLAGATLEVEQVPVAARCLECQHHHRAHAAPPLRCPRCGGRALPVSGGRELDIESVVVEDPEETGTTAAAGTRETAGTTVAAAGAGATT